MRHEFCKDAGHCIVTTEAGPVGLCDVERPTDDPTLEEIRKAMEAKVHARERLHYAVQTSRSIGRTWTEIGMVLGCSKQAARERFGP